MLVCRERCYKPKLLSVLGCYQPNLLKVELDLKINFQPIIIIIMRIRHIERVRARRRSVLVLIGRNRIFPHLNCLSRRMHIFHYMLEYFDCLSRRHFFHCCAAVRCCGYIFEICTVYYRTLSNHHFRIINTAQLHDINVKRIQIYDE